MNQQVIDHAYRLLSECPPDWSLDQLFYADQGIFDLEMKVFFNEQDKRLAENNQLGIRGSAYQPGPYSHSIAGGTRDFVRWYVNDMKGALVGFSRLRAAS